MSLVKSYPLEIVTLNEAIVIPTVVDRVNKTFTGGVYSSNGTLVHASRRRYRDSCPGDAFPQLSPESINLAGAEKINRLAGKFLYLGFYTEHYGHFLIESLGRLWASHSLNEYDGYVFSDFVLQRNNENGISPLSKLCLSAFNVQAKDVLIAKDIQRFQRLDVPTSMMYIGELVHPDMINILKRISTALRHSDTGQQLDKLYLSRSKLDKRKRKVVNEHNIEKIFVEHGYKVVHLQDISFPEQLALLHNAKVIAGLDGSALHNSVYMQPGRKMIHICGPRNPNKQNGNQRMCNELNNIVSYNIEFFGEVINEEKIISRFSIPHLKKWLRRNDI